MRPALISLMLMLVASPAWAGEWVLIAPRVGQDGNRIFLRLTDPVSKWEQIYAFDSASVCEEVRAKMMDAAKRQAKDNSDLDLMSAATSRCMPYNLWWQAQQPTR